jgi:hypothetical protein
MHHRPFEVCAAGLALLGFLSVACAHQSDDLDDSDYEGTPIGSCPPCAAGKTCKKGVCVDDECASGSCTEPTTSCNATTCPSGCCDGNVCRTAIGDDACGSGGGQCIACSASQTCQIASGAAACVEDVAPSTGMYQVVMVASSLSAKKTSGEEWDTSNDAGCFDCYIGCCPPDVYVSDVSQFAGLSIPKVTSSNTTSPNWNFALGTLSKQGLLGASVHVVLKDEDTSYLPDDVVGSCTTTLTAADVDSGLVTLDASRGCTGSIQSVTFRLDPT